MEFHQIHDGDIVRVLLGPEPRIEPSGYKSPFDVYVPHTKYIPQVMAGAPENATWVDVSSSPFAYWAAMMAGAPENATWVDVSSSPFAYWAAMTDWWRKGETFAIIEHDVVCRPDVIAEFEACPEPWCVFEYDPSCPCGNPDCREAWQNMIGRTRFRSELIAAVPGALTSIGPENWDWHEMCNGVGKNLRAANFTHHWHGPAVRHHPERES